MGAALSHSLHHSRCAPLVILERNHLRVGRRVLLAVAAFKPGCSAFRRPAQTSGVSSSSDSVCKQQLQQEQREEVVPNISLLADQLQKQWQAQHAPW
ncbi:TPA: hypothetical protein ACH3X2_010825 [Trebouxia sp. C0005]